MRGKKYPADKQALLDGGNYETYNRDIVRKVFPRIIRELKAERQRTNFGDIVPFYFTLLSFIDGDEFRKDGMSPNKSYEAAFPSQDTIQEITDIGTRRQTWLAEILRQNGLLRDYEKKYVNMRPYMYYYPSFCPHISDDGYVINAGTGEKYTQDIPSILAELDRINRRK